MGANSDKESCKLGQLLWWGCTGRINDVLS
jgi:hypothetical protein